MPYYQEKNGSISYYRSDSRFNPYTHGGHSDEHKEEIDRAINEIVDKKLKEAIPQIYQQAFTDAYSIFLKASEVDIDTIVKISVDDAKEIFQGEKCQRALKKAIFDAFQNELGNLLP